MILKKMREKQPKPLSMSLLLLHTLLLSLAESVITQYVILNKFSDTIAWIIPSLKQFIVTVIILFAINTFLYLITLIKWVPLVVTYPLIVLISIINYQKLLLRNEPFLPTDIISYKEAMGISSTFSLQFRDAYFFCFLVFILFVVALFFINKTSFNLKTRLIIVVSAIVLTAPVSYFVVLSDNSLLEKSYRSANWDMDLEYSQNGLINSLMENFKKIKYKVPKDYNEQHVKTSALEIGYTPSEKMELTDNQKPNIIAIMNESWYDDTMMTGLNISPNPLSPVQELAKNENATFGYALSGQLGGGTSNPEFEFLTGKSSSFYPFGSMIYKSYLNEKQWSIASYFNKMNYNTFATHGYLDWFWKRKEVYQNFGFDKMTFDKDLHFSEVKGAYISDMSIAEELLYELNLNNKKPNFLFAVTMQNHSTYTGDRYENYDINVKAKSDKTISSIPEVLAHAQGAYDASNMFAYLASELKNVTRPTYLIMFGDHAPYMVSNSSVFENGKITESDIFNSYKVPVVIWTNTENKIKDFDLTSIYNLPTILFENASLPMPQYLDINRFAMQKTRGLTWQYTLDNKGAPLATKNIDIENTRKQLEILQYDALYGKQYIVQK